MGPWANDCAILDFVYPQILCAKKLCTHILWVYYSYPQKLVVALNNVNITKVNEQERIWSMCYIWLDFRSHRNKNSV